MFLFYFPFLAPLVKSGTTKTVVTKTTTTTAATTKSSNKENVPANAAPVPSNRAILAVSIVKKPQAEVKTTLKPILKKSISAGNSLSTLNNKFGSCNLQQKSTANKLYEYAEIQKKHREMLARKIKAEEEKELKFKFQAKPAPKFKKAPSVDHLKKSTVIAEKPQEKKNLVKQKSMPSLVFKKQPTSVAGAVPKCGDPERIKLMEEHKKKLLEKYKPESVQFKAKPAAVLKKAPFQPTHNFKSVNQKPFNLKLTERGEIRSNFDKQLEENRVVREKHEEVAKKARELEEKKLIRQKTEFKARPCPVRRNY
jgi:hypothetical protein